MIQGLRFVILWSCVLLAASESSASCGPVRDNGWKMYTSLVAVALQEQIRNVGVTSFPIDYTFNKL